MSDAQILQWTMGDGAKLHVRHWPVRDSVATVCLIHGICEHAGRYEHVARYLNERNVSMVAPDLRGHGLSQGARFHVDRYDMWMDDLQLIEGMVKLIAFGEQVLYGHSMGGNLVLNYAIRKPCGFNRLVVTSPMIATAFDPPWWKFLLGRTVGRVVPSLMVPTDLDVRTLTSDPQKKEEFVNDELISKRISVGLGVGMIDSGAWLLENAERLKHPTFLMHGDSDLVTSHQASAEFARRAGDVCQFQSWPGMLHELHNEIGREKVLTTIANWIVEQ